VLSADCRWKHHKFKIDMEPLPSKSAIRAQKSNSTPQFDQAGEICRAGIGNICSRQQRHTGAENPVVRILCILLPGANPHVLIQQSWWEDPANQQIFLINPH